MRKIVSFIACIAVLSCILVGCGKKDYTGYYIYDSGDNKEMVNVAMEIDKDGTVIYLQSENKIGADRYRWASSHKGTFDKGENEGLAYFTTQVYSYDGCHEEQSDFAKYSPIKLTISEDGKKAFFSADSESWNTDTLDIVSEKEFREFTEKTSPEEGKRFILWNGERFMNNNEHTNQEWEE